MKVIKNDICYVELEDIEFLGVLPSNVLDERRLKVYYSPFINFEKYTKQESVDFFREKECILDYDTVSGLSDDELDCKIEKTTDDLNKIAKKILDSSVCLNSIYGKKRIERDTEINSFIESLKYILVSLKKYKDNRVVYEREIKCLSFGKVEKVELKKYPAYTRISPVKRIPVSSSAMEELDRSIKSKCEQNARRYNEGLEQARNYHVCTGTVNMQDEDLGVVLRKTKK